MECLSQCLGGPAWVVLLVFLGYFLYTGIVDAIPETWAVKVGPVTLPLGRILHAAAGNFVRALRRAPGGKNLPLELPKIVALVVLAGSLSACLSAGGMLKVQAGLWKDGGIAHLRETRPPLPGDDATAEELKAYGDWARAVVVASSTVCTEDETPAACTCADTAATSAIDCDAFLAGAP